MRVVMAAVGAVFVGLLAVGVLGVASAETTSTSTSATAPEVRTVSTEGVATATIAPTASEAEAKSGYREAMASAIADGKEKAQFLAEKAGASLGAVDSIAERGGYVYCPGEEQYTGAEPDFGAGASIYAAGPGIASAAPSRPSKPAVRRARPPKHRKRRRHTARSAAVAPCTLSTQVALVYELG